MNEEKRTLASGSKELLFIGALLSILAFIPGIGGLLGLVGGIIYLIGIVMWRNVDSRPLTLTIVNIGLSIVGLIIAISFMGEIYEPLLQPGIFKVIYIFLLLWYPTLAVTMALHRYVLLYFYEATGQEEFLQARNYILYGIITLPFLVGTIFLVVARIIEMIGYKNMTETPIVIEERPFEINAKEIIGISGLAVILSLVMINFLTPSFDVRAQEGKVILLLNRENEVLEGFIVHEGPCDISSPCIRKVELDGVQIYSPYSIHIVNNRQVIEVSIPINSTELRVITRSGTYTFNIQDLLRGSQG
ncbi:hypothetical protein [Pyrococcus abyssi]|uniref:Uncharacterized protein n=1 Tax=Pyrococcus abyssi (strain GE5 / Orsay) TaxID=272844 RepID=Q9V1J2_PYRAB|nr:hypothetical protein [Pyrococcus abyssi]CAB49357.1 Hypothetical protein PAB2057 [Pyrococcus abyssi GE5]CCE69816.1 TPA: hypothetical protein PAB2057 [Pyrococcus abyssi GE5]